MKRLLVPAADVVLAVLSRVMAPLTRVYASRPSRLPRTDAVWERAGLVPLPFHYYQPVFRVAELPDEVWSTASMLEGVDLGLERQLELLRTLGAYAAEIADTPPTGATPLDFSSVNQSFGPGDADVLYAMVRHLRPRRILEVGGGESTKLMRQALRRNRAEGAPCVHECIEPYEAPWLEELGLDRLIRQKVEDVSLDEFSALGRDDILFIDSSHVIRTGGDVTFLYLEVLPRLAPGVVVHVHDIFLPFVYPREWAEKSHHYWNEQYLLQAFLAFNEEFETELALAYLAHTDRSALLAACPTMARRDNTPGSFWLRRASGALNSPKDRAGSA